MKEVLRLIELKNEYLEKYLMITKSFVMGLEDGNLDDLELLKNNRENIIGIIDHLDEKINKLSEQITDVDTSITESAKSAFFLKEKLVEEMLETDARLFELINNQKGEIINNLNELRDINEAFKGYETQGYRTATGSYINLEK